MRRSGRKTKRIMAKFLSAVLLITSLPQGEKLVFAVEQAETLMPEESLQSQVEETSNLQMDSEMTEIIYTDTETETSMEKVEDSENTETFDWEGISETESQLEENQTESQPESSKMEESIEYDTESETEEQKTELEDVSDSQKKIEKRELEGVYQFGEAPTDQNKYSTYMIDATTDTNISELEEYLYQQMKAKNEKIDVEKYQINTAKMGDIVTGILNENPDLYFVNKNIYYTYYEGESLTIEVLLTYNNTLDDIAFQKATKEALAVIKSEMSDLEKAVALHDYLAVNCEYDKENLDANTVPDLSHSAYGVLVNRIAVCEGYALAYKYLLNQAGIECYMVTSKEMNHAWNLIVLNGEFYQVDVTWDDPIWDLTGRVRHQYMFRSDDAFVKECEHHDWTVTKGSEVVSYRAVDSSFDTAFWLNCNSPLVLVDRDCYYVTFDEQKKKGVINRTLLSDSVQKGTEICEIGEWAVWEDSSRFYTSAYSGLFQANNRLYFNDKESICSIALNDVENEINKRVEFTADTTNGYIYGIAFSQGKVIYSLRQKPSIASKGEESILTADVSIETEEPSNIPVEKIELDKESLILTVGNTAQLQASVIPSDATNVVITWISSDDSVAKVENGTITAVSSGSCTITVSAGEKESVCNVVVSESDENIASGSYNEITWVIDKNGKLTVTGTGEFAEPVVKDEDDEYYREIPWYENRDDIISAEICATGMTDASCMFRGCYNLIDIELSGFDTKDVTNMSYMFSGCGNLTSLELSGFDTTHVKDMRDMFSECSITSLDLSSFKTESVTNMGSMFYDCNSMTKLNVNGFKTENVTNMSDMFSGCSNLTSLDLSSFKTENVTNMGSMFYGCSNLTSLDLSSLKTGNVTNMGGMFADCSNLTSLDLSNFKTGNVTDMGGMFSGCSNLTSLDLSSFKTENVTDMGSMFADCSNLTSLDLDGFKAANVTNMESMFSGCSNLIDLDLSYFNARNIEEMDYMFFGCRKLTSINLSGFIMGWYDTGRAIFDDCISLTTIYTPLNLTAEIRLPKQENEDIWYKSDGTEITYLPQELDYSIKISKNSIPSIAESYIIANKVQTDYECKDVLNLEDITVFYYCTDGTIKEIFDYNTNINELDMLTPGIKLLKIRYDDLEAVIELNVTPRTLGEDIASGSYKDITWVIDSKGKLTVEGTGDFAEPSTGSGSGSHDFSADTKRAPWYIYRNSIKSAEIKVTGMTDASYMFNECTSLECVELKEFDTSNVTDMGGMFCRCWRLTSVDVSGFDTKNVTDMGAMFYYCWRLKKLDVSGFDTGNVTNMNSMFGECSSVGYLDVSNFNTSNVTNMGCMFDLCYALEDLDVSNFSTSNVTSINWMFTGCNVEVLDLSSFDLSNVLYVDLLFSSDELNIIYTPRNLKMSIPLPSGYEGEIWYQPDGTEITELPQNLDYSIIITKNHIPTMSDPYIKVKKGKTLFECGDILNTDDLIVMFYNSDGTIKVVTDYTTNASEIDMSAIGRKTLTVSYNGLTAEVEINVIPSVETDPDLQTYKVTFELQGHGIALEEYSNYIEIQKGSIINCPKAPEAEGYHFTGWYKDADCKVLWDFENDTVEEDTILYAGWETAEDNPAPDQETYTVTFDLQGHGTVLEEYLIYTEIPKGSVIVCPKAPEAEGYEFTGWYKDADCKILWDFENDIIEGNIILYAGWKQANNSEEDIPPKEIPDGLWVEKINDYTYTGKAITPAITVYYNKKKLTAGRDYTITYQNNIKAATATASKAPTVTVKGKGNYSGMKKAAFTIHKVLLNEEDNLRAAKIYPTGIKYTPVITTSGNILKSGTDYKLAYCDAYGNELKKQPTRSGKYQLRITGKGNCEGEIIFAYAVGETGGANMITKAAVSVNNMTYGNKEPDVTLNINGNKLKRDTDFIVSFANIDKKGTGTATVIGIGQYTGVIKKNFKVQAASIQEKDVTIERTVAFEKGGAKAKITALIGGTELVEGIDYTTSYKNNKKAGIARVILKGKGNYTGSIIKDFKVEPQSLTAKGIRIYVSDVQSGKKPVITIYDINGKKLSANSDYIAEVDKSVHQVKIFGGKNGLYKVQEPITITYHEIEKGKQITSVALNKKAAGIPKYFEYTGKEVELEKGWLTVKAGKTILRNDEYEVLGYINNIEKGTATLIIRGCNGYGGIKMLSFKIKARGFL